MIFSKTLFDRLLLYIISLTVCVLAFFVIRKELLPHHNIAFVSIGKLVEEYQLRKDLEKVSSNNLLQIKNVVDSLKIIQKMNPGNAATKIDTEAANAQYAFNKYYDQSNQEISKKIWERLNPLLEQYGKEKGMELLIGANGAGTVLYGSSNNDVTDDVIKYVNEKYAKGN